MSTTTQILNLRILSSARGVVNAALIGGLVLALAGCGADKPTDTGGTGGTGGSSAAVKSGDDGHKHVHDGARHDLGTAQVAGYTFTVLMIGDVKPDAEVVVEAVADNTVDATAFRLWIGDEAATGAMKVKAGFDANNKCHAHVETAATIPDGAKLWLAVEAKDGSVSTGSVALP